MPEIIPIRELENTERISLMCRECDEPVFITENGDVDMVIMSIKVYEETLGRQNIYDKLAVARKDIGGGEDQGCDGFSCRFETEIRRLRFFCKILSISL